MRNCPIHGNWTDWSPCDSLFGNGNRVRTCSNPLPEYGGEKCPCDLGVDCSVQECSGKYADSVKLCIIAAVIGTVLAVLIWAKITRKTLMLATKDVYDDFLEAEQMYLVDGVHQQDPADDAAATSDTQSQEVIVRTRGDEYFT